MSKRQLWYFTFGFNQGHDNCYTTFYGDFDSARDQMIEYFGQKWGFQYKSAEDAGVDRFNLIYINKYSTSVQKEK